MQHWGRLISDPNTVFWCILFCADICAILVKGHDLSCWKSYFTPFRSPILNWLVLYTTASQSFSTGVSPARRWWCLSLTIGYSSRQNRKKITQFILKCVSWTQYNINNSTIRVTKPYISIRSLLGKKTLTWLRFTNNWGVLTVREALLYNIFKCLKMPQDIALPQYSMITGQLEPIDT